MRVFGSECVNEEFERSSFSLAWVREDFSCLFTDVGNLEYFTL
jgi:hypothetical protein